MKKIMFILVMLLFFKPICAYSQSPTEALVIQARQNADAMLNKDYEVLVQSMYPPLIEESGGFQKTLALVKSEMSKMEIQDFMIEKITVEQPSAVVKEGEEGVAIVPYKMKMSFEGTKVVVDTYLVAITQNNGGKWYFIEGALLPKEKLSLMFPNLVATVEIPIREVTGLTKR